MHLFKDVTKKQLEIKKTKIFICIFLFFIATSALSNTPSLNRKIPLDSDYLSKNFSLDGKILLNSNYGIKYIFAEHKDPKEVILTNGKNLTAITRSGNINCIFLDPVKVIKDDKTKKHKHDMFFLTASFFLERIDSHIDGMLYCSSNHSLLPGVNIPEPVQATATSPAILFIDSTPPRTAKKLSVIFAKGKMLIIMWKFITQTKNNIGLGLK